MDLIEVASRSGKVKRHPWELARFSVINNLLKNIIRNDSDYSVLDIGCGDIYFVKRLSELYPNVKFYAIDTAFDQEMIKVISATLETSQVMLFQTMEEATRSMQRPADLVLLLDVVEHIRDDEAFLNSLFHNEKITSDTNILITVPAFQKLFCSHDVFLGHFRRYTNINLVALLKSCRFTVVRFGYFFSTLLIPRIFQVIKEKIQKPDQQKTTGLVEWQGGSAVTSLMKSILLTDFFIFSFLKRATGINIPGLSNYIICKKSA